MTGVEVLSVSLGRLSQFGRCLLCSPDKKQGPSNEKSV